jgi:uncharacterized protein (DUF58 family)
MDIHRAAEHHINPCIDAAGNRRVRGAAAEAVVPDHPISSFATSSAEDQDLAAAIAASRQDAGLPEEMEIDEDLARALRESQEEASGNNIDLPAPSSSAPVIVPDAADDADLEAAIAASLQPEALVPSTSSSTIVDPDLDAAIAASLASSAPRAPRSAAEEFDADMEAAIAASLQETTATSADWDTNEDSWH